MKSGTIAGAAGLALTVCIGGPGLASPTTPAAKPSTIHAQCMDEVLLDGMRMCLITDHGDPGGRRRVFEILHGRNLLSLQQRLNFRAAFSECVRSDARQIENFVKCQTLDARIPLNMGRSILGRPAVSAE